MSMRLIKILLSLSIALLCIIYAAQNLANIESAVGAVGYVISNAGHEVYPNSIGPSFTSPTVAWIALGLIVVGEFLAGFLALKGTWDLSRARTSNSADFQAAKKNVLLGAGVAMLVWFGLFQVLGGALFQQWQTEAGTASLDGAFIFSGMIGIIALFIALVPDDF